MHAVQQRRAYLYRGAAKSQFGQEPRIVTEFKNPGEPARNVRMSSNSMDGERDRAFASLLSLAERGVLDSAEVSA